MDGHQEWRAHTNDNKFSKLCLSNFLRTSFGGILGGVSGGARVLAAGMESHRSRRVRVNVVMRVREPRATKLVFFKLLPSRKPGQESYNCIPPSPPSICDLLIYWRGVGGVLRQYVANYPSKRTRKERLKQNTI